MSKRCSIDFRLSRGRLVVSGNRGDKDQAEVVVRDLDSVEIINNLSEHFRQLVVMRSFGDESDELVISRLRILGAEIYKFFLSDLENVFEGCESINFSHQAYFVPLEIAFDGRDFLGLRYSIGNWLDDFGRQSLPRNQPKKERIHMLFLGGQDRSIWRSIRTRGPRWNCEAILPMETDELLRRLDTMRYDVLHFTGHGSFDEEDPKKGYLWVTDESLGAKEPAVLSWDQIRARRLEQPLVFLNTCHSGSVSPRYRGLVGFADALLHAGAASCVATVWSISDQSATTFAQEFYNEMMAGESIGKAIRGARRACWEADPKGSLTSLSYILFGDPSLTFETAYDFQDPEDD